jgi:hypothetical protein
MKPSELADRYHNLVVTFDDASTMSVDVHRYRMWGTKHVAPDAEAVKDKLIAHINTDIKAEKKAGQIPHSFPAVLAHLVIAQILQSLKPQLALTYMGKGSPQDIAYALHLVAHYQLYDKHLDAKLGVKKYCDTYMGLDCNGFVGNYARATGSTLTPSTYIGEFAKEPDRRTKLEDVKPNDVLVWPDYGHIAIIDSIDPIITGPKGTTARDCLVVESTAADLTGGGDGLQQSTYRILSVDKHKKFTVERPKGGQHTHVYLAPLK